MSAGSVSGAAACSVSGAAGGETSGTAASGGSTTFGTDLDRSSTSSTIGPSAVVGARRSEGGSGVWTSGSGAPVAACASSSVASVSMASGSSTAVSEAVDGAGGAKMPTCIGAGDGVAVAPGSSGSRRCSGATGVPGTVASSDLDHHDGPRPASSDSAAGRAGAPPATCGTGAALTSVAGVVAGFFQPVRPRVVVEAPRFRAVLGGAVFFVADFFRADFFGVAFFDVVFERAVFAVAALVRAPFGREVFFEVVFRGAIGALPPRRVRELPPTGGIRAHRRRHRPAKSNSGPNLQRAGAC